MMKIRQSDLQEENPFTFSVASGQGDFHYPNPIKRSLKFSNKALERNYQNLIISTDPNASTLISELTHRLKFFLLSYHMICLIYFILYIISFFNEDSSKSIFGCQLGLFIGQHLINTVVYWLIFQARKLTLLRSEALQVSYFLIAVMLILNNGPVQSAMFNSTANTYISCLPGLLILLTISKYVVHTHFLNYFL